MQELQQVVLDTNILIDGVDLTKFSKVYLPITVTEELDKLKHNSEGERKYKARKAIKQVKEADNIEYKLDYSYSLPIWLDRCVPDNRILGFAMEIYTLNKDVKLISNDVNMQVKAKALGLPCEGLESVKDINVNYIGYKEVTLDEYELALHYQCPTNKWDLLNNEYLIIRDGNGDIVDRQKWINNRGFSPLSYKQIDNMYTGKIKPRNIQQELAFDLFQNKNITVKCIFGKHGSGKDLIMSAHALNLIQKGIFDKLIFVRNNYEVKNSKAVGFLPGTSDEKLMPFAMPLADHLGGVDGLKMLIGQGKIELQHLGFIRGRDIKNSIVYCTEAENMTKEHIQLLISRLGEGSVLWLNGDFKQVDDAIFERNSGLKQIINCLKGNELFGCVELNITERSKTAQLADLLG